MKVSPLFIRWVTSHCCEHSIEGRSRALDIFVYPAPFTASLCCECLVSVLWMLWTVFFFFFRLLLTSNSSNWHFTLRSNSTVFTKYFNWLKNAVLWVIHFEFTLCLWPSNFSLTFHFLENLAFTPFFNEIYPVVFLWYIYLFGVFFDMVSHQECTGWEMYFVSFTSLPIWP